MPKEKKPVVNDHAVVISKHAGDTVTEVHTFPNRKAALEFKKTGEETNGATHKFKYSKATAH